MEWLITGTIPKRSNAKVPQDTHLSTQQLIDALSHSPIALDDAKRLLSLLKVNGYIDEGIKVKTSESRLLSDYLLDFWDYEKNPYIKENLARVSFEAPSNDPVLGVHSESNLHEI